MKNTAIIIILLTCMSCSNSNNKTKVSIGDIVNIQFEIPGTISELSKDAIIKKSPNKARRPSKMFVKENDDTYEVALSIANDAFAFIATGGTVGNAVGLALAVEEGSIIGGVASVAGTALFLNDLDNLDKLINEDCE